MALDREGRVALVAMDRAVDEIKIVHLAATTAEPVRDGTDLPAAIEGHVAISVINATNVGKRRFRCLRFTSTSCRTKKASIRFRGRSR